MRKKIICRRSTALGLALAAAGVLAGCPFEQADLSPRPDAGGDHLVRLVHLTDPQIVDEESPARAVRLAEFFQGAWRPQEAYGVHTLDALLQATNRIHAEGAADGRPVDFVLMTGDLADSAQVNELQWFLDTMDGKVVTPDSGTLDGPLYDLPDELNPKLPYDATGLDPEIPWYTCYGNHDGLAIGVFPVDRSPDDPLDWFAPLSFPAAHVVGLHDAGLGNNAMVATDNWSPAVFPEGLGWPFTSDFRLDVPALMSGPVVPDAERQFLSPERFIAMHLESTSPPRGHGFTEVSRAAGQTFYSTRPDPEVPLRLIVFDSVIGTDSNGNPAHYGALTVDHYRDFVKPALDKAAIAGEWVILASHHPIADFDLNPSDETVRAWSLRGALAQHPNLIMHLYGHIHRHRAEMVPGPYPYLEVSTAAIIDYPQEGRVLDIFVEDGGDAIRVESTIFGHMDAPTTFSAESYRRAERVAGSRPLKATYDGHDPMTKSEGAASHDFSVRLRR